jgi:hypothetical protein
VIDETTETAFETHTVWESRQRSPNTSLEGACCGMRHFYVFELEERLRDWVLKLVGALLGREEETRDETTLSLFDRAESRELAWNEERRPERLLERRERLEIDGQ